MTIPRSKQTILVVEDDQSIAELLSYALADVGFVVHTAPTVSSALAQYNQLHPDLVVADLVLPDGLGSDLLATLREWDGHTPAATLMMSAHPHAREHALVAGADACLPKPFDLDEFYATVGRLVQTMSEPAGDPSESDASSS